MSRRAARRRKNRSSPTGEATPSRAPLGLSRTNQIALGFLGVGLLVSGLIVGVVLALGGLGGDDEAVTAAPTGTGVPSTGSPKDQQDIEALARRSIEVLPAGEWPSLYNDFTADFRSRCALSDFTQAGVDSATNLGAFLQALEFKELKGLIVRDETAEAVIVGGYEGQTESNYDIQAAFRLEDGRWKLAPAPGTTGCSGFNQLN